jgi:L-fucose isomerase-like protein
MSAFDKRITLGLLVASRNIFNGALAVEARRQLLAQLDRLKLGQVILPAEATPNGAVETPEDVRKCVQLFRERRDEIDGIVVVLPNFGDELAVAETVSRADLRVPVLVQACNDEVDKVDLRSRRDAFCGKLSVCNNFRQYGIAWTDTAEHTCDLDGPAAPGPHRRHRRTHHRLPDRALQREAAAGLGHHGGDRGPLRDPGRGQPALR